MNVPATDTACGPRSRAHPRAPSRARSVASALASGALLLGACLDATRAAVVTLDVKAKSGVAAEDTVVVFDPLDAKPPVSRGTVVIDQLNKTFIPRVTVIRTGTSATFPNSDRIRHQVYSFSKPKTFSLKLYAGAAADPVIFDKPGLVILGCNIHDSMVAFVAVVDTPYFAKIPHAGSATVNLPAGSYRMRVWHAAIATDFAPRQITVGAEPLTIPLIVDIDAPRDEVAAWPD